MTLVDMLIGCGAVKFGDFTLTSGKKSRYYIDIKQAITDPMVLSEIARQMTQGMQEDRVAGMELGAVPIATAVSLESKKPQLIIRKEKKGHGRDKLIEGKLEHGDRECSLSRTLPPLAVPW